MLPNVQAPANRRPHKMRNVGEEALHAAQAHAEKLGKLIMVPRVDADAGEWGVGRDFGEESAFVPFKLSGGARSGVAVAKFANDSSVLSRCVVSFVRILCAGRTALFPNADKGTKGGKGGRRSSFTKLLQRYLDDSAPRSQVPVDSASLEEALRRASEDEASKKHTPSTPLGGVLEIIAGTRAEECQACSDESELSNSFGLVNVVGYSTGPRTAELDEHFRNFAIIRCGPLARTMACVDLAELGVRHGVLPDSDDGASLHGVES